MWQVTLNVASGDLTPNVASDPSPRKNGFRPSFFGSRQNANPPDAPFVLKCMALVAEGGD
jgi:hypothetical protein